MPKNLRSLLFAAILCVVCSVLLTAASTGLKPFQQRNMLVDRQKNVLKAFGIVGDEDAVTGDRVQELYQEYVKSLWVNTNGQIVADAERKVDDLPLYVHVKDETIQAYVVPIDTRGLWGKIQGYLAIENDGVTVRGFTVYQHQETPGLGGEIESRWFRKNFEGKKILSASGDFVSVSIAKGNVADMVPPDQRINFVDGISGATMTGKFLSQGLHETLQSYEPVAIQFRHDKKRYLRTE